MSWLAFDICRVNWRDWLCPPYVKKKSTHTIIAQLNFHKCNNGLKDIISFHLVDSQRDDVMKFLIKHLRSSSFFKGIRICLKAHHCLFCVSKFVKINGADNMIPLVPQITQIRNIHRKIRSITMATYFQSSVI